MTDNPKLKYQDRFTISRQPWEINHGVEEIIKAVPTVRLFATRDQIRAAILKAKDALQPSECRSRVLALAVAMLEANN